MAKIPFKATTLLNADLFKLKALQITMEDMRSGNLLKPILILILVLVLAWGGIALWATHNPARFYPEGRPIKVEESVEHPSAYDPLDAHPSDVLSN